MPSSRKAATALRADGTEYVPRVEEPEPEPMQHAEMEGGFHGDAEVELGQSMVTHGVAKIGELQFECGGEINEQLWGAGATLAAHFLHDGPTGGRQLLADQPDVVELGSGTGMTGLACACAGAGSVILTDQEAGVQRLEEAIEANAKPLREAEAKVSAAALPWGDLDAVHEVAPTGCDLIIGADVTYSPPNFDALLETCYELSQIRGARILIATEKRWGPVNNYWEEALAKSALEQVGEEVVMETPARLPRPVVMFELQAKEDDTT